MNIERLKILVRGILDIDECMEAMKILSDSKTYSELVEENKKLKKQIEDEQNDHAAMENALARARLRAEGERDVALLASDRISEEEFLKRVDARWNGRTDVPDDALNPMGKMLMKMRARIKELEEILTSRPKGKPESQLQAELLADMHVANRQTAITTQIQSHVRDLIDNTAIRFKVFNQMQAILLEKK